MKLSDQKSCPHRALQKKKRRGFRIEGKFYLLVGELKLYHSRYQMYFRMSVGLLQMLAPHLSRQSSKYREAIDPQRHLVVCLR